ncbi:MAG TPA: cytochrome C [Candidatus Bathyarchaeia archaeon]|nr:cytochrome C [Candidatus Bathyarchaeia archaeon]
MIIRTGRVRAPLLSLFGAAMILSAAGAAWAIPSYARQTNLSCNSCHNGFPKLNAFGRIFKLNAYTLTGIKAIESTGNNNPSLKLTSFMPISAMVQTSLTALRKPETGKKDFDVEFPQQLSFFLAGEITPYLGTFIQATYDDQSGQFGWDNADIRLATRAKLGKKSAIVGVTLNNNPTVQDVWNTAPAWAFPFVSSGVAPAVLVSPLSAGPLAQQVAGLGAYAFYNNALYGEISFYASTPQGGAHPANGTSSDTLAGANPYWRLAYQAKLGDSRYLEVGTYGFAARLYPAGISGPTDRYTDLAVDAQYEQPVGPGGLGLYASYVHERQDLRASFLAGGVAQAANDVESLAANASYIFRNSYGLTVGFFDLHGTNDPILYVPGSVTGSRRHLPNGSGFIVQASVYAWQNAMIALQYTAYTQFNGARVNYDGFGRNASDNNTLYAVFWIAF